MIGYRLQVAALVLILLTCCGGEDIVKEEWVNLLNLGPTINSPGKDEHITLAEEGKTMFFASDRTPGAGGYDIYMSTFENGEWTKAVLLPEPINSKRDEFDPFITLDGKKLFFASNRNNTDPYYNCDIYVSEWDGKKWSVPRIFDKIFVTPEKPDWGAAFTRDFKTMIFSSSRGEGKKSPVQIFQSKWLGNGWSEPELLPAPVNSGVWEATPFLTPDGKTLYLNSGRSKKDKKDVDIWKFESIDGKWTNAELMKGPFFSDAHDYDPCLSPDGKKFYFTSTRKGGFGDADLYVVERKK